MSLFGEIIRSINDGTTEESACEASKSSDAASKAKGWTKR